MILYNFTVPAVVPPLVVSFINDSPRVQGDSVEAEIALSRPVQSLVCRLKGKDTVPMEKNCEQCAYSWFSRPYYTIVVS